MKLFTITIKPAKKRAHFAPKTQPHVNKKAYSRKKKHKPKEN